MHKPNKGNALVMVAIASMAILLLVATSLAITSRTRETTHRQRYFANLYNLAVTGNEQALALLQQGLEANRAVIQALAYETGSPFPEVAAPFITEALQGHFSPYGLGHQRYWTFHTYTTAYFGSTTLFPTPQGFLITTEVEAALYPGRTFPLTIQGTIRWEMPDCDIFLINCLDYYRLLMVELLRVAD